MKTIVKYSESEKHTQALAEVLTRRLLKDERIASVFTLNGNLGSGKTAFAKGVARVLGIKRIISPTFILIRKYNISKSFGSSIKKHLFHIDLYRLNNSDEIKVLNLEEILKDKSNIVVIEWADKLEDLPRGIDVSLKDTGFDTRKITVKIYDSRR